MTEARGRRRSPLAGKTVADLKALGDGEVEIVAILRDDERRHAPLPDATLRAGDILLLRGEPEALERVVAEGELEPRSATSASRRSAETVDPRVEAVIIGTGLAR